MSLIQVIILLAVLGVWWRLYVRFTARELQTSEFIEWFLLWLVVGLVAMLPNETTALARLVGVGRGSDLVVYLALLLAFYLLGRVFVRLESLERNVTKAVREAALQHPLEPSGPDAPPQVKK